jgi:tetratricopeptide (TPR) repeat protein
VTEPSAPEVGEAFAEHLEKLRKLATEKEAKEVAAVLRRSAVREVDFDRLESTLEGYMSFASEWKRVSQEALNALETLRERSHWARYDETGWREQRKALSRAFKKKPETALNKWAEAYADALASWELEFCHRLVVESFPFPPSAANALELFRTGTDAIRAERFGDAEPLLELLVGESELGVEMVLGNWTRGLLLVMLGRIETFDVEKPEQAFSRLEKAHQLVETDGRTSAGLGDYHRRWSGREEARSCYARAIEISPDNPQGYVGMGLLAEDQELWDIADDWYAQAIPQMAEEGDVANFRRALRGLRAPTSGNVYLELARKVRRTYPRAALDAVERAIELGVHRDGENPDRIAHKLKGRVLESLGRFGDAALAYLEAGSRFYADGDYVLASDSFQRSAELDPSNIRNLGLWADTLYLLSERPDHPYVDAKVLRHALRISNRVERTGPLGREEPWAYVSRARMIDRLGLLRPQASWQLTWRAITLAERALLIDPSEGFPWAVLAQFLRNVRAPANALLASERAVELSPNSVSVLAGHAAVLSDLARFGEAERALAICRSEMGGPWADAAQAFCIAVQGRAPEALPLARGAVEAVPGNLWYQEVLAQCCDLAEDDEGVLRAYETIWSENDPGDFADQRSFGRAALNLGKLDDAVALFRPLCDLPAQAARAHQGLALTYLAKGDLDAAATELELGVRLAAMPLEFEELRLFKFPGLERRLAAVPHAARMRAFVAEWAVKMDGRQRELESRTPKQELGDLAVESADGRGWEWVGACAVLARISGRAGRWEDAVPRYEQLAAETKRFPEAELGLAQAQGRREAVQAHRYEPASAARP